MAGGERPEVIRVAGQHDAAPALDGRCDHQRVDRRRRACRAEERACDSSGLLAAKTTSALTRRSPRIRAPFVLVPSARFERALTAPEADALSPELRGRGLEKSWEKTPGDANFGAGGMLAESSAALARVAGGL